MKLVANNISVEVEDSGAATDQHGVVLLIMGLGMQLIAWPPMMVRALVDAGYRVIRFDNRDIGLSQHFDHMGVPNLVWQSLKFQMRLPVRAPYRLHDMALDALGVLDALQVPRAHVVGVSMGGMIAQRVALAAPQRVHSLTSIMSSSGARGLPQAQPHVVRALMGKPASTSPQDIADHYVRLFQIIGSPGFPVDEKYVRERIAAATQRSFHPAGTQRQMLAIMADSARAVALHALKTPTLVMHGKADPLVPYPNGEDTARRIQGARMVGIDGMGHDLPPGVVERLLHDMLPFLRAQVAA
jgi:pimeloyl-ACP methyl ester carboxylesterase